MWWKVCGIVFTLFHLSSCESASVILKNTTNIAIMEEGESHKFECYATGDPSPLITWIKIEGPSPGYKKIHEGNVLEFPSVTHEDAGDYACIAHNGVGQVAKQKYSLEIQFVPVITNTSIGRNVFNQSVLTCYIKSYPYHAVTWIKIYDSGEELEITRSDYQDSRAVGDYFTVERLLLNDQLYNERINYACQAANKMGLVRHVFDKKIIAAHKHSLDAKTTEKNLDSPVELNSSSAKPNYTVNNLKPESDGLVTETNSESTTTEDDIASTKSL